MKNLNLRFGSHSEWQIAADDGKITRRVDDGRSDFDFERAIESCFSSPIDFPSLEQMLVEGDRLALAVETNLPRLTEVVPAIVSWFVNRGVSAENIQVVLDGVSAGADASPIAESLRQALAQREELVSAEASTDASHVVVEVHDPDNEEQLSYLAANEASDAIYLNRTLVDADVVLPISCARYEGALDYFGAFSVFPLFSDRVTFGRFYTYADLRDAERRARLGEWAQQAAWWAGFMAQVQVLPSAADSFYAIVAGSVEGVDARVQAILSENALKVPREPLVIALMDGALQQGWLQFSRALEAAARVADDGGTLVLCTELAKELGNTLLRLHDELGGEQLLDALSKANGDDALAASMILEITEGKRIYLASEMDRATLENFSVGVLEGPSELQHLLEQFSACAILDSAQHQPLQVTETSLT